MDHNPHLAPDAAGDDKGNEAGIERPDRVDNVAFQTRRAPPTASENALADALQALFAAEVYDLASVVAGLERRGLAPPAGEARWTEAAFRAELSRLGR
jgi:predicted transcriptional regulator